MTTTENAPSWKSLVEVRRFGRYLLFWKLAEGGMAEIFLAKQLGPQGFERDVVVKRMLRHLGSDPAFVTMFLDEARLAARLFHPNIVQITDLGTVDGQYFICMEYLPGEDLARVISAARAKNEQIPLAVACKVMAMACDGLGFAHDFSDDGVPQNIVHRDMTPSNILLTYQGTVKLVDFGIAKAETQVAKTSAGTVKGKWSYMSPEQVRGDRLDRRSDIFSLGLTLFELLTLHRPCRRENELATIRAVLSDPIPDPREFRPDLPPRLAEIVGKALTRDLAGRYQTTAELAHDLEQFLTSAASIVGSHGLSLYMNSLFGPEAAAHKTQLPSIKAMREQRIPFPPSAEELLAEVGLHADLPVSLADLPEATGRKSGPVCDPASETVVTTPPLSLPPAAQQPAKPATAVSGVGGSAEKSGRNRRLAAVLGALVLPGLGAGAALLFSHGGPPVAPQAQSPDAQPPPAGSDLPGVPTGEAIPADAAEGETPDASQPVAAPADAAVPEPVKPESATVTPKKPLTRLNANDIATHVGRARARLLGCFEQHRALLTSGDGKVVLTFTILQTGKVSAATVDLQDARLQPLSKCIVGEVKRIRFPRHLDKEVTVSVPFVYKVTN